MAQPLTDAITALTRYANETTGASDTTLSDAVETLVEGYGQGGGGSVSQDAEGYIVLPVDGGGDSMPLVHCYDVTITEDSTSFSISDTFEYAPNYVAFIPDGEVITPPSGMNGVISASFFRGGGRATGSGNTNGTSYFCAVGASGGRDYYTSAGYATTSTTGVTVTISRTNPVLRFIAGQKFKVIVGETTDVYR